MNHVLFVSATADMSLKDAYGERLIASVIDYYAKKEPGRVWASVPRSEDLSKGFTDITYKQFANAINHACWWLESSLGKSNGGFEIFAYAGPKDQRFPILAVAAVKVGRQILLPSPFATAEAQQHVLKVTKCQVYLHSESMRTGIERIVGERASIRQVTVPEIAEWLSREEAHLYVYNKSWDEAKLDPWIIFHTSGTTGLPKPITYTNLMMTSLDAARTMPDADADQETPNHHFANDRWYTPLPTLHFVGMTVALQMTVFLGTVVVFGPADKPATAAIVDQILEFGDVAGTMLPPSLLEDLCRNSSMLERVRKLQYVHYAGAPLSVATGNLISQHVKLVPAIGSTEAGAYFPGVRNDPDWNYYSFRPSMGVEFEQRTKELYELVFRRKQKCERWQQVFFVYPDVDYFPTKDLWAKHPTKPDLWDYAGRTDDLVILSHGEDLHASKMEAEITNHPTIRSAIIGGEGRKRPFLILELERETEVPKEGKKTENDGLWSAVEKANEQCSEYVRLSKELTMFTEPTKPFVRTAKGTVARRECLTLYMDEISALYAALGE